VWTERPAGWPRIIADQEEPTVLATNLAIASGMVGGTVVLHFVGLAALIAVLNTNIPRRLRAGTGLQKGLTILFTVFGLVLMHTAEIWAYACLYLVLGEFDGLEAALYFSTTTFSTLGYGDITLSHGYRLVGAIEGANGFLLIGWSTAFLVSVTNRMGLLEARLKHSDQRSPRDGPDSP
jgi:voltage-gated potassium channel